MTTANMTAVNSSMIEAVGYTGASEDLYVTFTGGKQYRFAGVPHTAYIGLMSASSKGRYMNDCILGRYASFHADPAVQGTPAQSGIRLSPRIVPTEAELAANTMLEIFRHLHERKSFTFHDITKALREAHPDIEIVHEEVKRIGEGVVEILLNSDSLTVERRPVIWARVYTPTDTLGF